MGAEAPDPEKARPHAGFNRIMHRGTPLALHVRYTGSDFGSSGAYMSDTFGRTPSFLCVLQLHDYPHTNGWRDGVHFRAPFLAKDGLLLLDLRHAWMTEVNAPFDNIHLQVTQALLDDLAEECELGKVEISTGAYATFRDETLRHLAHAVRPALRRPTEVSSLFVEHIAAAAAVRLIQTHGGCDGARPRMPGGLAPWQERRARDFIGDNLDTDIALRALAAACGLSPAHFAKAFKRTVGMPPHRWVLQQRVALACDLLANSGEPLEAIAFRCGFADQSHMNRVFTRAIGTPPGAWRRMRRS